MKVSNQGGKDFAVAPTGTHRAVCTSIVDVGTQYGEYQGKETKRRQVIIGWELVDELIPEGHGEYSGMPFFVSKFYTASLSEKATLRAHLEAWRGRNFTEDELRGFDLKDVLGVPALITVTHSEQGKARVASVSGLPKGTPKPSPVMPLRHFSLDEFDETVFNSLPNGYKKFIVESPEYKAIINHAEDRGPASQTKEDDEPEDDLPF